MSSIPLSVAVSRAIPFPVTLASIAVVQRTGTRTQVILQDSIGYATTYGVPSAEFAAIAAALKHAKKRRVQQRF